VAPRIDEEALSVRRIIACFAPGAPAAPAAVAELARHARAELLALFIEDTELLRFAALPLAAEVGIASAAVRTLDAAAVERALRAQARALRQALAEALEPAGHAWSFRVARASPRAAVEAVLAEGFAPSLLLPPGVDPRAERRILRSTQLHDGLRELLAAARPVLILPD
jgi:hypothetical protein